jgi:hypothetical protein
MLTPPTRNVAWTLLWNLGLGREIFRFLPNVPQRMDFNRSIFLNLHAQRPISLGLALAAATFCVRIQADEKSSLLTNSEVSRSVRAMRQALRISNDESDEMAETLAGLDQLLQPQPPSLAKKKRFLASPTSRQSRLLMDAMAKIGLHSQRIAELQPELTELGKQEIAPPPLIDGDDLIAAGFSAGPRFRRILDTVYDAQLEGRISTKEEAILLATSLE